MGLRTFKLTFSTFSNISNFTTGNDTDVLQPEGPYQTAEAVIIVLVTGSLSLTTITGNILVLLSVIINRNLQTINNYFLCSLACADLFIGACTINLYTVYLIVGYWPFGPVVCDLWLVLDYAVFCASAWHLIIISIDRYFCVIKPISYPARRTTRVAFMMIAAAWVLSFILWTPAVLFWHLIKGERTVPEGECDAEFLSNPAVKVFITITYFYLPVAVMILLYWQISRASKSRVKKGKHNPKQDNSSNSKAGNHIPMPCDDDSVKTHCAERSQNGGSGGVGEEELSAPGHHERNEIAEAPAGYEGNPTAHSLNAPMEKQLPTKKALPSREKRVTRTVLAILVAYVVTWSPYCTMMLISTLCSTCIPSIIWTLCAWFVNMNSAVNPACYALCNVTFKKTFIKLLLCQHKNIRLGR